MKTIVSKKQCYSNEIIFLPLMKDSEIEPHKINLNVLLKIILF